MLPRIDILLLSSCFDRLCVIVTRCNSLSCPIFSFAGKSRQHIKVIHMCKQQVKGKFMEVASYGTLVLSSLDHFPHPPRRQLSIGRVRVYLPFRPFGAHNKHKNIRAARIKPGTRIAGPQLLVVLQPLYGSLKNEHRPVFAFPWIRKVTSNFTSYFAK